MWSYYLRQRAKKKMIIKSNLLLISTMKAGGRPGLGRGGGDGPKVIVKGNIIIHNFKILRACVNTHKLFRYRAQLLVLRFWLPATSTPPYPFSCMSVRLHYTCALLLLCSWIYYNFIIHNYDHYIQINAYLMQSARGWIFSILLYHFFRRPFFLGIFIWFFVNDIKIQYGYTYVHIRCMTFAIIELCRCASFQYTALCNFSLQIVTKVFRYSLCSYERRMFDKDAGASLSIDSAKLLHLYPTLFKGF